MRFMEKMYKYKVAGHVFAVSLPQGYTQEEYLKPYIPFVCEDDSDPLFTLRLEMADSLRELNPDGLKCISAIFPETTSRYLKVKAECMEYVPSWHHYAGRKASLYIDEVVVN